MTSMIWILNFEFQFQIHEFKIWNSIPISAIVNPSTIHGTSLMPDYPYFTTLYSPRASLVFTSDHLSTNITLWNTPFINSKHLQKVEPLCSSPLVTVGSCFHTIWMLIRLDIRTTVTSSTKRMLDIVQKRASRTTLALFGWGNLISILHTKS